MFDKLWLNKSGICLCFGGNNNGKDDDNENHSDVLLNTVEIFDFHFINKRRIKEIKNQWYYLPDTQLQHKNNPSMWINNIMEIASNTNNGMEEIDLRNNKWRIRFSRDEDDVINNCNISDIYNVDMKELLELFEVEQCVNTMLDVHETEELKYRLIR